MQNPAVSIDSIRLRPDTFYEDNQISFFTGAKVSLPSSPMQTGHLCGFRDAESLHRGLLHILPQILEVSARPGRNPETTRHGGSLASTSESQGDDSSNVFSLRTVDDANAIAVAASNKRVVLVGASFIGLPPFLHSLI